LSWAKYSTPIELYAVKGRRAVPFMGHRGSSRDHRPSLWLGLGVIAAYLLAGSSFGQLPALTVPLGIIAAIAFALLPALSAPKRLLIMVAGTTLFILLGL